MEYALSELMTRQQMLLVLRERHIQIKDSDDIPLNELQYIYKQFALPRARREPSRHLHSNNHNSNSNSDNSTSNKKNNDNANSYIMMSTLFTDMKGAPVICKRAHDIDMNSTETLIKRIKLIYVKDYNRKNDKHNATDKEVSNLKEQQQPMVNIMNEYFSNRATKRIKID